LSLICGVVLIAGRILVTRSVAWPIEPTPAAIGQLIGDSVFYFALVGFIEELLFRGVIYRAFGEWRGARWAIWGSALMFGVYHAGWQGVVAVGTVLFGVISPSSLAGRKHCRPGYRARFDGCYRQPNVARP
jgi:membrane protease YdiL (CAAX protease family)